MVMVPIRNYRGSRNPPRWWEKLLSHPYGVGLATMSVVFGSLLLIATVLHPAVTPSTVLSILPWWHGVLMGLLLLTGGVTTLASLLAPWPDLELEYLLERTGLTLSALAWVQYGISAIFVSDSYLGALILGFGMALTITARIVVTHVNQGKLVRTVEFMRRHWP